MKLLLDWSVLCHICWHKMASPDYEARTDIEQAEFARNIAGAVLYFIERFQPEETIIALDGSKYWRYDAFNKFYAEHTEIFMQVIANTQQEVGEPNEETLTTLYYMAHDKKTYRLEYHDGMEKYLRTKLKKAEIADLAAGVEVGNIKRLAKEDIPYEIMEMYPQYKGARKASKWNYTTTREEFKALCKNIAKNLGHTFGARVIHEDTAEADDVAYMYHGLHPKEDMIFLTTDSDWHQLLRHGKFLKIYDPRKADWVEKSPEQVGIELAIKIISGDSSDGIAGLCPTGGAALIGPKGAEKMVLEQGVPGIYKYLESTMPEDSLKRNLRLIYLKNCPRKVKDSIIEALKKHQERKLDSHKPEEYGLEKPDILSIKASAEEARSSDLEEGIYEE